MPAPETSDRWQKALLWEATGYGRDGQPTVTSDVEEISVRWEKRRSRVVDPLGNVVAVDATVVVDLDVPVGSIMWEGSIEDLLDVLPGTGTGTGMDVVPPSDLMEVVIARVTPDIKNRATRRTLGLVFYKDAMPEFSG